MVVTGIELHGPLRINMINVFILIAGLLVYAGYGFAGLAFLLGAVLISYILGLLIPKQAWLTWIGLAGFAAYLLLIKLEPVTGMQLLAPMGLSYFCLQIISYLADVHRKKYPPERNFFRYALFVTYLPHLFIGPIERYDTMMVSLHQRSSWTWNGFSQGLIRILWGLFKKFVIAARAGIIVSTISGDTASYSGAYALGAMLLYSIQIYADFPAALIWCWAFRGFLAFVLQKTLMHLIFHSHLRNSGAGGTLPWEAGFASMSIFHWAGTERGELGRLSI